MKTPHSPRRAILVAGLSTVVLTGTALYLSQQRESVLPTPTLAPAPSAPASVAMTSGVTPLSVPGESGAASAGAGHATEDLWAAFESARRSVNALTPEQAALPINEGVSHFSYQPSQDLTARYGKEGVSFARGRDAAVKVGFEYDDGGAPSELSASGTRAEYHHGDGVVEWFDNGGAGIEHGFTLSQRPAAAGDGSIQLEVALSGLEARGTADPDVLELGPEGGEAQLRYSTLKAWDAEGTPLLARMEATEKGIRLSVDDRSARYPVTIDPLITTIEHVALPEVTGAGDPGENFGYSVAIDGSTAVIGARFDSTVTGTSTGSAYVFTRPSNRWTLSTILAPDAANEGAQFGTDVDIDGDTIAVGAGNYGGSQTPGAGAIFIYTREGVTWRQEDRIQTSKPTANQSLGQRVKLSGDTIMASSSGSPEACHFFVRNGLKWTLQQEITAPANVTSSFARSIALDRNTALIATERFDSRTGAYLYIRSGTTWSLSAELQNPATGNAAASPVVALDGFRAALGYPSDRVNGIASGAVYVFTRNISGFWNLSQMLSPSGAVAGDAFGSQIVLDGDRIMIGQPGADYATYTNAGAIVAFFFNGSNWVQRGKSLPSQIVTNLGFGRIFALDETNLMAGQPTSAAPNGIYTGRVEYYTVLESGDARRLQTIDPGDSSAEELFGTAVAIDGETAAVGAPGDYTPTPSQRGSVYVLTREGTTWSQQAKLYVDNSQFGSSVALSGNTLLAGALTGNDLVGVGNGGKVWAFVRNGTTWTQQDVLLPDEGGAEDEFSFSMAIDGDRAVIGSPARGSRHGSAFIYERSGGLWYQQAKLEESPRRALANFGSSVAVEGSTILIGVPETGAHPGCAYVYGGGGTTWTQQAKLDGDGDMRFGKSVSMSGHHLIIGAPEANAAHIFSGAGSSWTRVARLALGGNDLSVTAFGQAVAIDGDIAVVGADKNSTGSPNEGATFVFGRENSLWSLQDRVDGGVQENYIRTLDLSGDLVITGSADEAITNPYNGMWSMDAGTARIYRLSGELVNSPESQLLNAFDEDASRTLAEHEWQQLYVNPPSPSREKFFIPSDTDEDFQISLAELTAAGTAPATAKVVGGWIARAAVFGEVDANADGEVTRSEIALMWAPATPAKTIDAFWSRAKGGEGLNLMEWVKAKTLPSFPTFHQAQETRAQRLAAAESIDADENGIITRSEFAELLGPVKDRAVEIVWKAATGTPKKETAPASMTTAQFVESPKLPKLPNP